jgi:PKD repeat protein
LRALYRPRGATDFGSVEQPDPADATWGIDSVRVGLDPAGNAHMSWSGYSYGSAPSGYSSQIAQRSTGGAGAWAAPQVGPANHAHDLAVAADGTALLGFSHGNYAKAALFTGGSFGSVAFLNSNPVGYSDRAVSVSFDDEGNALAVWQRWSDALSQYRVYAAALDAAGPGVSLTVPATAGEDTQVDMSAVVSDRWANVDPSDITWAFGDGTSGTGASPSHSYADSGAYVVTVTAKDAVGHESVPVTANITITDTTAPQTVVTSGPANASRTNTVRPTFGFGTDPAEGGVTYECRFDSDPFAGCAGTSKQAASDLGEGPHTFEVRATDSSGNTDATPASRSFTVDLTPPTTTVSGPVGRVQFPSFTLGLDSPEAGATFRCAVDGGGSAACTSPFTPTGLSDGPHTVSVWATDAAGNEDASAATTSFTVDRTAPALSVTAPADNAEVPEAPTVTGSGGTGTGDEAKVYAGVWKGTSAAGDPLHNAEPAVTAGGAWSWKLPALAAGTYTLVACQYDDAVNYSCVTRRFTIPGAQQETTATASPGTPAPTAPTGPQPPQGDVVKTLVQQALAGASAGTTQALAKLGLDKIVAGHGTTTFEASVPGEFRVELLATPQAKAAAAKQVVVASGRKVFAAAGKAKVKIKPSRRGKRLLRRTRKVTLTLRTTFTPAGGQRVVITRKLTVKKKRKKRR